MITSLPDIAADQSVSPARSATDAAVSYRQAPLTTGAERAAERLHIASTRVASFDFIKGALVLLMVLYHWLNYFIGLQWGGYRYLRFLTPSFIFITGFLVSHVYLSKYAYDDPRLRRRLVVRGARLLTLFLLLNIVADRTLGIRLYLDYADPTTMLDAAYAVFVEGSPRAAFDVLVSISYFLVLAPIALVVSKRLRLPLFVLPAVAVASMLVAESRGFGNPHCEMLSIALMGLAAGAFQDRRLAPALGSPMLAFGAYLVYLGAITVWDVPFRLQVVGVPLSLFALSAIADVWGTEGLLQRYVRRLGQYSLLAYIAQIVILQVLRRGLRGIELPGLAVAMPLAIGVIATIAIVELTARLRVRSNLFDRSYRVVFA